MKDTFRFAPSNRRYLLVILFMAILGIMLAVGHFYLLPESGYRLGIILTALIWIGMGAAVLGIILSIFRMVTGKNVYLELNTQGIKSTLLLTQTLEIPWLAIRGFELRNDVIQKVIAVHLWNEAAFLDYRRQTTGKAWPMADTNRTMFGTAIILPTVLLSVKAAEVEKMLNEYLSKYGQPVR
ncbi:MAG: hypothetical protein IM638_03260 [Bacteroidetes bacterium]|nr:hypothetical protein [Bacteroidota bacterium]